MATLPSAKICFFISPMGDEDRIVRRRADQLLRHVIKPATLRCGYRTIRADQISKPGIITSQIVQHLMDDPLVIADLTGRNPNVFYELALRHATRKPLVQLANIGESIPFDVSPTRTLRVNLRNPDSISLCRKSLIRQIRGVERNPEEVDNPISTAIDIRLLKKSR